MGNIQFYNGQILFVGGQIAMDPACCCGGGQECQSCGGDPASVEYDVTIAGALNQLCGTACQGFNDTFRVSWLGEGITTGANTYKYCSWQLTLNPTICSANAVVFGIYQKTSAPVDWYLQVYIRRFGVEIGLWRSTPVLVQPDCDQLSGESLAYVSGGITCNFSGATCTVSSV